jgi:DnaJ family protein C protein 7
MSAQKTAEMDSEMEEEEESTSSECSEQDEMEKDEDANDLKNQGNTCYGRGDYQQALGFYDRAIKKDPDNAKIYGNRAAAYMMLGRYEDCIVDCKKAIEIDPSFVKAFGRLAKAYFLSGDIERSLDKYREAITLEINPDLKKEMDVVETVRTCYTKCRASLDNKEYDKALTYAKLVLKEAPDAAPFKVMFCEALICHRKPEEACQILAGMMRDDIHPDVLVMRAKGLFYSGQQQIPMAINHLTRALQDDPDNGKARVLLKQIRLFETLKSEGNGHFSGKRWAEAIEAYTKALEVDPGNRRVNSVLYCNRAAAYKEEGKLKEAIADCSVAIQVDEGYVKAYQRRGRCYQANDEHEEAVRDFEKVKTLNPTKETAAELREAKILLKRSKRKDYYKILGVSRDADDRTIKKAYREQALKLHPDKLAGFTDEEKAKAEQQFKDVGEAYAVLTDPQKKYKYDNGTYDDGSGQTDADDVDGANMFNMFFGGGGGPQVFFTNGGGGGRRSRGGGGQHFSFHM